MKIKKFMPIIAIFLTALAIVLFNFAFYALKYPINYRQEILKYSNNYNLEPEFVASVINAESSFNKDALSNKGAVGLMQILPSTGEYIANLINEEFTLQKLYEPETNIKYGCFYLNYLFNKFHSQTEVLCAYNAGETVVNGWLKNKELSTNGKTLQNIPYKATKNYTQKILNSKKYYIGRI